MKMIVESLKRLYEGGKLTKEQVTERVKKGTITPDEYTKVTGEPYQSEV